MKKENHKTNFEISLCFWTKKKKDLIFSEYI